MRRKHLIEANCPECDFPVYFRSQPYPGKLLDCPACREQLEVLTRNPLVLTWAMEADELDSWDSSYDLSDSDAYGWAD